MGKPKALIELDGIPLWERQIKLLREIGPKELMISAGNDWNVGQGPWTVLRDRTPVLGPIEGIAVALASMSTDFLLVLAIDMPAMSAAYLLALVGEAGPMGIVPVIDGCYQGLAAIYPRSVSAILEDARGSADRSLQHFIRRALSDDLLVERPVSEAERGLFRNVNRPEDLP
jgi:molybdenum cofactor guanylyltransferase